MKRVIVNLSTSKYVRGQQRLFRSLIGNMQGDAMHFQRETQVGAPSHQTHPYAFKPYAMREAKRRGYDSILWLDASMLVLRDITPIFEEIEKTGYFFQDSGWTNDRWTTPEQEAFFGTNKGKMISSGVLGLSMQSLEAQAFLARWRAAAAAGMFNGSHDITRHDQTAASLIIQQMGLKITDNETYWKYGQPTDTFTDNIVLIANGIV